MSGQMSTAKIHSLDLSFHISVHWSTEMAAHPGLILVVELLPRDLALSSSNYLLSHVSYVTDHRFGYDTCKHVNHSASRRRKLLNTLKIAHKASIIS